MRTVRILLCLICFMVSACSSILYHSPDGSSIISLFAPPFEATSTLPLLATSKSSAFILAENTFQTASVLLSIYGSKDLQAPLSIVAFSFISNNRIWIWDYPRISPPYSQIRTKVNFGEKEFYGKTYKLHGSRDAFTLWLTDKETAKKTYWLVQRYSKLLDFRQKKLILEYREPFPPSLFDLKSIPENDPIIQAFMQRAQKSFSVRFAKQEEELQSTDSIPYAIKLNTRYLYRFLGSIDPIELYPLDDR